MANPYATENWLRKEVRLRTDALERCMSVLEDILQGESAWTTHDVDSALEQAREAICKACREGKPHTSHTRTPI